MNTTTKRFVYGCGDIALRTAPLLRRLKGYWACIETESGCALRSHRITPVLGNLDIPGSLVNCGNGPCSRSPGSTAEPRPTRTRTANLAGSTDKAAKDEGGNVTTTSCLHQYHGVYGD